MYLRTSIFASLLSKPSFSSNSAFLSIFNTFFLLSSGAGYILYLTPSGVVRASYPSALVGGLDMGPFSYAQDKAGRGGGPAVSGVQVGVVSPEALAVKPLAADVLPAGFPAVPLEGFRPLLDHCGLELAGEDFGLRLKLLDHGPDAHQVAGGAVQLVHAHGVYLLFVLQAGGQFERRHCQQVVDGAVVTDEPLAEPQGLQCGGVGGLGFHYELEHFGLHLCFLLLIIGIAPAAGGVACVAQWSSYRIPSRSYVVFLLLPVHLRRCCSPLTMV